MAGGHLTWVQLPAPRPRRPERFSFKTPSPEYGYLPLALGGEGRGNSEILYAGVSERDNFTGYFGVVCGPKCFLFGEGFYWNRFPRE